MFDRLIPIMIICMASMFYFRDIDVLFMVSLVILVVYTIYDRRICFDMGDVLLVLGAFSYYLSVGRDIDEAIYYACLYVVVYQLGKKIATVGGYSSEQKTAWMSVLMGVAMMIMGVLHYSVRPEGITEEWVGWGQTGLTPRTQFEVYLVIIAALLGYFILLIVRSKLIPGFIGIIMSLVCVYLGVSSAGRFAIGCCFCGTVTVLGLYFVETEMYKRICGKLVIVALLGIVVILPIVYTFDLFGYRTVFDDSFMAGSGGFFTNTRFSLMLQQIKLFRYYPLGNCDVRLVEYNGKTTDYAHNLWIDIGREGGVIPAVLFAAFSIINIISMIKVSFHSKDINKYATIAAFVGAMAYAGLECVVGMTVFRCSLILLGGLLKGISDDVCGIKETGETVTCNISFSL